MLLRKVQILSNFYNSTLLTILWEMNMKFFKDFYKYNEEAPIEGSKEWIKQYEDIKKLGDKYISYLNQISNDFPEGFLDIYFKYSQFQGWDLNNLNFNHNIYNHPNITITLTHVNIKKEIKLIYYDVKSFYTNLRQYYFDSYKYGKPGIIGVNEFIHHKNTLSHEIYFNTPESIKIHFKKIDVSVIEC